MRILSFTILIILAISLESVAATRDLDTILLDYQVVSGLKMKVKKIVKSELLDKESIYDGSLVLSKGKIYWETSAPEKSLLVFDGKLLWTVQYPAAEFKSPPQVAKTNLSSKGKNKNVLVSLLNSKSITEHFVIVSETASMPYRTFTIKSKHEDMAVKDLQIKINIPTNTITQVSYMDEVENKTTIMFEGVKKNQKIKADQFSFKPPKDAAITNY